MNVKKEQKGMNNLVLFINSFLSYLLVFGVFVAVIIFACVCGVTLRKNKNKNAKTVNFEAEEQ